MFLTWSVSLGPKSPHPIPAERANNVQTTIPDAGCPYLNRKLG